MIGSLTTIARYSQIAEQLRPLMLPEHLHARVSIRALEGSDVPSVPPGKRKMPSVLERMEPSTFQQQVDERIAAAVGALVTLANPLASPAAAATERVMRESVPLAAQLGMWRLKRDLEDAVLRITTPDRYQALDEDFAAFKQKHTEIVRWTCEELRCSLRHAGLHAQVKPAFCSVAGVARRLAELGADDSFERAPIAEFYDLSVLVHQEEDCYPALAAVHRAGTPIPGTLRDLVAAPQANGFSGILAQIALDAPDGADHAIIAQVNIQTYLMNAVACFGVAEQECYKYVESRELGNRIGIPRCIESLLDGFERSVPRRRMIVLAEGGDSRRVKAYKLAAGATVLDLAYKIHSKLGNKAAWARVNKRRVDLSHILKPYDRVEIARDEQVERSEDDLALVTTKSATRYLRHNLYQKDTVRGRSLLKGYLERERTILLDRSELDRICAQLAVRQANTLPQATPEALYRAISGSGEREHSPGYVGAEVVALLASQPLGHRTMHDAPNVEWVPTLTRSTSAAPRRVKLCGRCSPRPQDSLQGVVLSRYLAVHVPGCSVIGARPTVAVHWRRVVRNVDSTLVLFCEDRARLVQDVCQHVAQRGAGLAETHATTDAFSRTRISIRVYTRSAIELGELLQALRSIPSVRAVELDATSLSDNEKNSVLTGEWIKMWRRRRRAPSQDTPPLLAPLGGRTRRYADVVIPYNDQRPVFHAHHFFGRGEERAQLIRRVLGRSPSIVFLTAPRRTGKTSLALRFMDELDADERLSLVKVDLRCERRSSSEDILRMIATALRSTVTSMVERHADPRVEIASVVRDSPKPIVLVLDEFGAVLESYREKQLGDGLFAWIRMLLETDPTAEVDAHTLSLERLRLILVSPPEGLELLAKSGVVHDLKGRLWPMHIWSLDRSAAHEMAIQPVREAGVYFAPKAADELAHVTGRHPYFMIPFLKELARWINEHPYKQDVSSGDITEVTRRMLRHPLLASAVINEAGGLPEQHACLGALARHGSLNVRDTALRAELDRDVAFRALQELRRYTVVDRHVSPGRPDSYEITIPYIRSWVRRNVRPQLGMPSPATAWDLN